MTYYIKIIVNYCYTFLFVSDDYGLSIVNIIKNKLKFLDKGVSPYISSEPQMILNEYENINPDSLEALSPP